MKRRKPKLVEFVGELLLALPLAGLFILGGFVDDDVKKVEQKKEEREREKKEVKNDRDS